MKLRYRYRAFRWGIYWRHPLCCVIRFTFSKYRYQGARRGGCYTEKSGYFVPCLVFHQPDADQLPDPYPPRFLATPFDVEGRFTKGFRRYTGTYTR
jgi:hypothetical protein